MVRPYNLIDGGGGPDENPPVDTPTPTETPKATSLEESLANLRSGIAESKQTAAEQNIIAKEAQLDSAIIAKDEDAVKEAALELERAKAAAEGEKVDPNAVVQTQIDALQQINDKPTLTPDQERLGFQVKWIGGVNGRWQVIRPSAEEVQLRLIQEGLSGDKPTTDTTTDSTTGDKTLMSGFTAGQLPVELQSVFGNPDIIGYKINKLADGTYAVEVQTGSNTTQTFGAKLNLVNGRYVPATSGVSTTGGGSTGGGATGGGATGAGGTTGGGTQYYTYDSTTGTYKPVGGTTTTGGTAGTNAFVSTTGTQSTFAQGNIITVLQDRFAKYGLGSLTQKIIDLAVRGATEDTIAIELQATPEYQLRFKANQERIKKNLAVLSPAEYIALEDSYRQVLRAYGLTQFDNDEYVSQFISNDVSPAELSNRVVTAVQRVQNADPAISNTLRDYYGIGQTDLVAYVLDPNQQFQKIERQVAAAEIGTAARRQGLEPGVGVASQLAAQGISQAEAQKGYATIADILPTAQKLSDIYGNVEEGYGLAEAEQEVFNSLASAQRRRQRLTSREIASFSGQSGLARGGLADTSLRGQF